MIRAGSSRQLRGILSVRAGQDIEWTRQWCELKGNILLLNNIESFTCNENLNLNKYVVLDNPELRSYKKHCFELTPKEGSEEQKKYLFSAQSFEQKGQWTRALSEAVKSKIQIENEEGAAQVSRARGGTTLTKSPSTEDSSPKMPPRANRDRAMTMVERPSNSPAPPAVILHKLVAPSVFTFHSEDGLISWKLAFTEFTTCQSVLNTLAAKTSKDPNTLSLFEVGEDNQKTLIGMQEDVLERKKNQAKPFTTKFIVRFQN